VQWHLALCVGNDLTVAGTRLEYCMATSTFQSEFDTWLGGALSQASNAVLSLRSGESDSALPQL
jgi:hypothetical protein